MPFVEVGDFAIYYEICGTGDRAIVIGGTGSAIRDDQPRAEGPLEQRFEVLKYDQRGLGRSGGVRADSTMADYADDAAALIAALDWTKCHVVGISLGGMVAQHLAIRHPERVDRLVLACTSSGGRGGSSYDLRQLNGLDPSERLRVWLPILDSRNNPEADPPVLAPGFEGSVSWLPQLSQKEKSKGELQQLEARARHDAWEDLPRITAETLVICGRYDRQAPRENSEELARRIPGSTLAVCEGGHLFLRQDPNAWKKIVSFLSE
jgi:3-oxoadipate enol-lactonase